MAAIRSRMLGIPVPIRPTRSSKVVAKLGLHIVEVKRRQSLEDCLMPPYPSRLSPSHMNHLFSGRTSKLVPPMTLLACALAVATASCKSLTGVPASLPTIADTGVAYALNGAPPGAPTSLDLFSGQLLAADASFVFDVAFDIDSAGDVVYLPQRAVASGLASTHSVGLQTVSTLFDSLGAAPTSGYRADTA